MRTETRSKAKTTKKRHLQPVPPKAPAHRPLEQITQDFSNVCAAVGQKHRIMRNLHHEIEILQTRLGEIEIEHQKAQAASIPPNGEVKQ